jgi:polysaccharide export outer membrane protein
MATTRALYARARGLLLALCTLVLLAGCASGPSHNAGFTDNVALPPPDASTSPSGVYEGGSDYRIGAQDLLQVSVYGIDDLSRDVRVNSNGQISLPLIGGVMAGGKTIPELEKAIGDKLKGGYLQDPQVSVFVKEFTSQQVTLEGELKKPGIYPLTGRTTLLQAIALAQGLGDLADLHGVIVFRTIDGKRMGAVYDIAQVRAGNAPDPEIYGDDVVVVEKSGSRSLFREFIKSLPALGVFALF